MGHSLRTPTLRRAHPPLPRFLRAALRRGLATATLPRLARRLRPLLLSLLRSPPPPKNGLTPLMRGHPCKIFKCAFVIALLASTFLLKIVWNSLLLAELIPDSGFFSRFECSLSQTHKSVFHHRMSRATALIFAVCVLLCVCFICALFTVQFS